MVSTIRSSALKKWAFFLFMLLAAYALRVYRLDLQNIWGDEAVSIWLSKKPFSDVVSGGIDPHPPLYAVLLYLWLPLAGDSAFAARYLSVLPGMLLIPGVYVLGQRLTRNRTATLAASLMVFAPFAVYYSQETRMYSWVAAFSVLSTYSFVRLLQQPDGSDSVRFDRSTLWYLLFFGSALAAIYTHYYGFSVLLAQNVFALWHWRKVRTRLGVWLALQVGLALAYVPWIVIQLQFLRGTTTSRFEAWGPSGIYDVWGRGLIALAAGITVSRPANLIALGLSGFVAAGLVIVVKRRALRSSAEHHKRLFLATYLLVPLSFAWLTGPLWPFFWERFLIVILPAYLLLLAIGLLELPGPRLLRAGGVALIVGISAFSLRNYFYDAAYTKSGYGNLMAYVQEYAQPGDAFLLANRQQESIFDYYGLESMPRYWFGNFFEPEKAQAELKGIAADHNRLWLVMFGNPAEYDPEFGMESWLSQNAFRAYHGDYIDTGLSMYVVGGTEPTQAIEANFRDLIGLTGYGLSSESVSPGDTLELSLAWQSLAAVDTDYTIFTHLVDDQSRIWAQVDNQPLGSTFPTSQWEPGQQVVDRFALQLDSAIPPGDYYVQVGWYDATTLERLPVLAADGSILDERVVLAPVRVEER